MQDITTAQRRLGEARLAASTAQNDYESMMDPRTYEKNARALVERMKADYEAGKSLRDSAEDVMSTLAYNGLSFDTPEAMNTIDAYEKGGNESIANYYTKFERAGLEAQAAQ